MQERRNRFSGVPAPTKEGLDGVERTRRIRRTAAKKWSDRPALLLRAGFHQPAAPADALCNGASRRLPGLAFPPRTSRRVS